MLILLPVVCVCLYRKDYGLHRERLAESIVPFLNAARTMVTSSCHLVLLFILILILVDTLSSVLWIYLKR